MGGRLVQQNKLGLLGNRLGNGYLLPLTAADFRIALGGQVQNPQCTERLLRYLIVFFRRTG
ncbi:hypothetical protein D3C76_1868120 [compost metagenome]